MWDFLGDFLGWILVVFFFTAYFMALWTVLGDLFRSADLGGLAKTLWVLFLIVLPLATMLVYLLARGGEMAERAMQAEAKQREQMKQYVASVSTGAASEIETAKRLVDSGAITQEDFEAIKAKAMA